MGALRFKKVHIRAEATDRRQKLRDLILYEYAYAVYQSDIGRVRGFQCRLEVDDRTPIRHKPIPYGAKEREWVDSALDRWV